MTEVFVTVEKGMIQNYSAIQKTIYGLKDGRYLVTFAPKNKRTLPQNNWLHAILPDIQKRLYELGWYEITDVRETKKFIKSLFFRKTITNGEITQEIIEDTSDTSKEDFTEKAEQIIAWCWEYLNLNVAPPGKQVKMYQ